ncbi:MAG TPA: D-aminoacylase [Bacteroidota bacterium]|jgi:N-acyl-D-amino-acid deacylase|nr:D-aminoacylase [Bacteroidota bacterium]
MSRIRFFALSALLLCGGAVSRGQQYSLIIRNGMIYDGSGMPPVKGDIAIMGDSIVAMGSLNGATAKTVVDAGGLAVSPGFINMLAHCEESLIEDGRSEGELREGVTLEVFGESSMGPLSDTLKKEGKESQADIKYDITWTTLGDYLDFLEKHGISTNVASLVGAGTVRSNVIGYENRPPTPEELEQMRGLVRQAMKEGALGLTSALQYVPDVFAKTDELIALAKVASEYGGIYTSHIRSEGRHIFDSIDELITISREAHLPAEIYHLKTSGKENWAKQDSVLRQIEAARASGLPITADMYTYVAAATGLDISMPAWVQEGGYKKWAERLKDPAIRERLKKEITTPDSSWDNGYLRAGSPENILLVGFKNEKLKQYTGKSLGEISKIRGTSPVETMMDLVVEDGSRVGTVYFLMSEENVRKQIAQPWVSFGSDEASQAPEGVFLKSNPHPRAYGTFARLLGKYVRDEKVISLEEAVRRMTSFSAANLHIARRGMLKPGNFADVVIFDPAKIEDHATFDKPHQYATGVRDVFVNGVQVIRDGEHTGAKPGRFVRGPGWNK